jgi:single-strand DNA-binding protein
MAGVNKVIILGRLGKDPETRTFDSGDKVCNIAIATSESYLDREGVKQERTEWHNVVLRNKQAEIAQTYLLKGREVYIEGKLRTRQYQDSANQTRYITEIIATQINLVGGRNDANPQAGNTSAPAQQFSAPSQTANPIPQASSFEASAGGDDDLPF